MSSAVELPIVEDMYADIPNTPPERAYTNLVMEDNTGAWLCPRCSVTAGTNLEYIYKSRGYRPIPEDYKRYIPLCYDKEDASRLYFRNPACVTTCQNTCDEGFNEPRCPFNRQGAEKFRDPVLERKYDKLQDDGFGFAWCSLCSVTADAVKRNKPRENYIHDSMNRRTGFLNLACDPWFGQQRFIRRLVYDGTEHSLKCGSEKWGAGNHAASETIPCPGFYGAQVRMYFHRPTADDSDHWEVDVWDPPLEEDPRDVSPIGKCVENVRTGFPTDLKNGEEQLENWGMQFPTQHFYGA